MLTPQQITSLLWPARSRYGIADKQIKLLIHSSDSEAWIKGELKRRALDTDQLVIRL